MSLAVHADKFYALLRMVAGLLFSMHGMQKLFGWPPSDHGQPEMWSQIWIGGVMELTLGLMMFVGLFTRLAAFLASGEMAVAYIQMHWKVFSYDKGAGFQWHGPKFDNSFWPVVNQGELAVIYCFLFLYFVFAGSGRCSLDNLLRRRSIATPPPPPASYPPPPPSAYPRR
jgi:putative oxidoreductase